jgi:hypothetical protein
MRPRWIDDEPAPNPPRIGTTVIALWRPWLYYLVSTVQLDDSSQMQRLIKSLDYGGPFGSAPPSPNCFVTQVVRCDKYGVAKSWDHPLLEMEWDTAEDARAGHQRAVQMYAGYPLLPPKA